MGIMASETWGARRGECGPGGGGHKTTTPSTHNQQQGGGETESREPRPRVSAPRGATHGSTEGQLRKPLCPVPPPLATRAT